MRRFLFASVVVAALLAAGGYVAWPYLQPAPPADDGKTANAPDDDQTVAVSEQAQQTLGLVSKPVSPTSFWKTISVPGVVTDRPGVSDRGVTTPVTGVVTRVRVAPGEALRPGKALFDLRITSELLLATQARLFELSKEVQLQEKTIKRLEALRGSVAESQITEAQGQLAKLTGQRGAARQLLQAQGLTSGEIDEVVKTGEFVREVTIKAPAGPPTSVAVSRTASTADVKNAVAYEVQELKVQLGDQVTAGQVLAVLANHRLLFVEGRAFASELPRIEEAAREGFPIEVEAPTGKAGGWETLTEADGKPKAFRIRSLGAVVDPKSRTVPFYLPLENEATEHSRESKTYLGWRFRPGQRVRLYVAVERLDEVIVLPRDAVVREGAEAFVFRQNGDAYERKAVTVLYEDRRHVVLSKASLAPGLYVAMNNAQALNRALKSQAAGGGGHEHHHHH